MTRECLWCLVNGSGNEGDETVDTQDDGDSQAFSRKCMYPLNPEHLQ